MGWGFLAKGNFRKGTQGGLEACETWMLRELCTEDGAQEYGAMGKNMRQKELLGLCSESRTQCDVFGKQDEVGWARGRGKIGGREG